MDDRLLLYSKDNEKCLKYAEEAEKLSNELNYNIGKATSSNVLGIHYYVKGNYPKALEYFHEAILMNEKIGNISFYDSTGQQEMSFNKPFSEKTSELIDLEVRELVEKCYNRAIKILSENREGLDKLASILLDKEVIFSDDLKDVFGQRPWGDTSTLMGDLIPSEEDLEETRNDGLPVEEETEN